MTGPEGKSSPVRTSRQFWAAALLDNNPNAPINTPANTSNSAIRHERTALRMKPENNIAQRSEFYQIKVWSFGDQSHFFGAQKRIASYPPLLSMTIPPLSLQLPLQCVAWCQSNAAFSVLNRFRFGGHFFCPRTMTVFDDWFTSLFGLGISPSHSE
jgi:hypothetical protein